MQVDKISTYTQSLKYFLDNQWDIIKKFNSFNILTTTSKHTRIQIQAIIHSSFDETSARLKPTSAIYLSHLKSSLT